MGCYPLGKMMSKALGKCNGNGFCKERRRATNNKMVYSPPPTYYHTRTVVKSVNFSNDNPVIVIPAEAPMAAAIPKHHYPETVISPSAHANSSPTGPEVAEPVEPVPTQRTGSPTGPKASKSKKKRTRFRDGPDQQETVQAGPAGHDPGPVYSTPAHRYVPSPLPRWEDGARRREYFSGEYCYYPTPIREGIYNIATDANRLTTIFCEENPNACTIV